MSKRNWTNIQTKEPLIIAMREAGMTRQEIADELNLTKQQIKWWVSRYNRRKAALQYQQPEPKPRGRPRKDGQPPKQNTETERAPVAVMLHGFPGLEQNMDMPPALRRSGIATLYFSYRSVWGSHGYYCFSHLIEDTFTVVNWIREHAAEYRLDPERIYLVAHSMGGFTAINAIAQGVKVRGAVVMAPCDMALRYEEEQEIFERRMRETVPNGYFRLPHEDYLCEDMAAHHHQWRFHAIADKIPQNMQLHFIGAIRDEAVSPEVHTKPIYNLLRARGMDVSYQEFDTGHIFTSCRIALTDTVFDLIAKMESKQ